MQSLDTVAWDLFTVPVKSSSRWEARLQEQELGSSASFVRLSDAAAAH
jgi:hypothetical protein